MRHETNTPKSVSFVSFPEQKAKSETLNKTPLVVSYFA